MAEIFRPKFGGLAKVKVVLCQSQILSFPITKAQSFLTNSKVEFLAYVTRVGLPVNILPVSLKTGVILGPYIITTLDDLDEFLRQFEHLFDKLELVGTIRLKIKIWPTYLNSRSRVLVSRYVRLVFYNPNKRRELGVQFPCSFEKICDHYIKFQERGYQTYLTFHYKRKEIWFLVRSEEDLRQLYVR